MKRLLSILILLMAAATAGASSVSGTLRDATPSANLLPYGKVVFSLSNCAGSPTSTVDNSPAPAVVPLVANSSGVITGTVLGNDKVKCDNRTTTWYRVSIYTAGGQLISSQIYQLTDSVAFNINTANVFTNQVTTNPNFLYNAMTTRGDLIMGDINGVPVRLPIGPNGTCLVSNGLVLGWGDCGTGGSGAPFTLAMPDEFDVSVVGNAATVTWAIDPTDAATPSAIAERDSSGNISFHIVTLGADPTSDMQAATKEYVDSAVGEVIGDAVTSFTGDVTGTGPGATAATVVKIQNHLVASGTLATHQVLISDDGTTWNHRQATLDDLGPAFAITGFSCNTAGNYEIGHTVSSPTTCSAGYSSTPNSASLNDHINSVVTLTSPFTSGTLSHSYVQNSQACVTITLSAVQATSPSANSSLCWFPLAFGGVGSGGATTATASGTSAVLNSSHGTLASLGLTGSGGAGTYGPFSPSGQAIYFLLPAQHSTFKDQNNLTFQVNSPITITYVNDNGVSLTYYLYQSTSTSLSQPFTVTISN